MNEEEIAKVVEKNRMLESDNQLQFQELKKKNKIIKELTKQVTEKDLEIVNLKEKIHYLEESEK